MKVFLGILTWLLILLIFGLPLALCSLWKWLVLAFYSGRRIRGVGEAEDDVLHSLPASDSMLATGPSSTKPVVNVGFALKLASQKNGMSLSISQLREHFAKCFLEKDIEGGRYEKFFSYLVSRGGYVFRAVKKNISLEDHIIEVNEQTGKENAFIANWLISDYKLNKPSWEIVLVSIPSSAGGGQLLGFKIHHALADGYSILHILDKLTGNQSPYLVKDFKEGAMGQVKQLLEGPLNLGKIAKGPPPEQNPFRVRPDTKHEWMVSFTSFPLEKLKEIRRKHQVHMSSVVMAITSGALREFLKTEKEMAEQDIPETVPFGTTMPWPKHPSRDARTPNELKMCNYWVGAVLKVPLRDPDPISRMRKIDEEYQSYTNCGLDKFTRQVLMRMLWALPPSALASAFGMGMGEGSSLTSIIGGDNYSLLGCTVQEIHPFLAMHDYNAVLSLPSFTFSHSGKLEMTFGAHPSEFRNQECLDNFSRILCQAEFDLLLSKSRGT